MSRPFTSRRRHRGLSLLEVILAIAILGGALAVIGQLIRIGARSAAAARDLTAAQLYCESALNEVAAGVIEPVAASDMPCDETGEWMYSVAVEPVDDGGLLSVTVTVTQSPDFAVRPVTFSLTRWLIDPAVVQAAEEQEAAMEAEAAAAQQAATETEAAPAGADTEAGTGSATGASGGTGNPGGNPMNQGSM